MQRTVVEIITPTKAKALLATNQRNRALRPTVVEEYARQMKAGLWLLSPEGIATDTSGALLNGQHRLHAVVASGCSVKMNMTYDADPECFAVLDCGVKRTVADRLPLLNDKESNRIAIAIVSSYLRCGKAVCHNRAGADLVDDEFLDKTDAYVEVTSLFRTVTKRSGLSLAPIGAALASYVHLDKEKGLQFTRKFITGEELHAGHPAYTLREAALQRNMDGDYDQYWKTISACMADHEGRPLLRLMAATKDFHGNVYKRLSFVRKEKGVKAAVTRKARAVKAST